MDDVGRHEADVNPARDRTSVSPSDLFSHADSSDDGITITSIKNNNNTRKHGLNQLQYCPRSYRHISSTVVPL